MRAGSWLDASTAFYVHRSCKAVHNSHRARCPSLFSGVCPQILFTAELNRRLSAADVPVDALCLHPGNVLTEVVRSLPPLVQTLYRALLTHVLFTPQEGETGEWGCRERAAPAARRQQAGVCTVLGSAA